MELILILVVVAIAVVLLYQFLAPNLDTNKDGKVEKAEVIAVVKEVKAKTTAAAKKATTRKPKTTTKK